MFGITGGSKMKRCEFEIKTKEGYYQRCKNKATHSDIWDLCTKHFNICFKEPPKELKHVRGIK
jgi:hypothetical protein